VEGLRCKEGNFIGTTGLKGVFRHAPFTFRDSFQVELLYLQILFAFGGMQFHSVNDRQTT